MKIRNTLIFALLCLINFTAQSTPAVRIKDIAHFNGVKEKLLTGIGIVTGLSGKGDSSGSELLKSALAGMVSSFGFDIEPEKIKSKNCAVVMISCVVPPFIKTGMHVDIKVSSIGDANSLERGVLMKAPLKDLNGQVCAYAQGQIFSGTDRQSKTVGKIPGGAVVSRDIICDFISNDTVSIVLRNPDFVTAEVIAKAVKEAFSEIVVVAKNSSTIDVKIPPDRIKDPISFIAKLESLSVRPDASSKVVIDSDSGIIIFGEKVRIGKVAVSHKTVKVSIGYYPINEQEKKEQFSIEETTTVDDLVRTLTTVGLSTETIINLLKAIDRAGALFGQLIIM